MNFTAVKSYTSPTPTEFDIAVIKGSRHITLALMHGDEVVFSGDPIAIEPGVPVKLGIKAGLKFNLNAACAAPPISIDIRWPDA